MAWRASRVLFRPEEAERRRKWSVGPGPAGRGAPPAPPPPRGRGCSCSKWSERPDPGTCTLRAAWRRQTRYVGRRGPGRARRGSAMSRPRPTVGVVDYRKTPVVRRRRARPENGRRVQAGSVPTAGVGERYRWSSALRPARRVRRRVYRAGPKAKADSGRRELAKRSRPRPTVGVVNSESAASRSADEEDGSGSPGHERL